MSVFSSPIEEYADYELIEKALKKSGQPVMLSGCIDSQKAHLVSCLARDIKYKVIVTTTESKAKELCEDYKFFDKNVVYYPAKDFIFYSADIHSNLIIRERLKTIKQIIETDSLTVVTTIDALADCLLGVEKIRDASLVLAEGDTLDIEELKAHMTYLGYERMGQVETPGQYAIRGGIIDIFSFTEDVPYRIELWDDEIDSIRTFDVESQRSIERIQEVTVFTATEAVFTRVEIEEGVARIKEEAAEYARKLRDEKNVEGAKSITETIKELCENIEQFQDNTGLDKYIKLFGRKTVSFADYFDAENTLFILDEPNRLTERMGAVEYEYRDSMTHRLEKGYILPSQADIMLSGAQIFAGVARKRVLCLSALDYVPDNLPKPVRFSISTRSISPYNNKFDLLVSDLKKYKKNKFKVVLVSNSRTRADRLVSDLRDNDLEAYYSDNFDKELLGGEIMVTYGSVHSGYEYPLLKFVVIAESDIFGQKKKKTRKKKVYEGKAIASFNDLAIGDYVVHENHGLGIYRGIEKVTVEKVEKDYIKIEYSNNGNLYILATQLDKIQKYAGQDAKKPKLNRLGGQEWNKTKSRVKGAVAEVAKDLVELYAVRQQTQGFQFSEDTVWQREFEELFPYDETEDQLNAIEATKEDMESKKIMDRLICGDVGYGKTEIAIRAAFKAVQDGKQVVYLCPTTILAGQHFNTFEQRMKDFPVRIALLSRFRSTKEIKTTIEELKKGLVDIVIGTHRVLSADVSFKNLGLLIIDEEQRFGVAHKEKIKKLKENVDVLTLSATPIPRTLHMSLVGIRDMSVLEEPPQDRMPIQTFVTEYNEEMVREAINRELNRDGQVYYVYNKVRDIDEMALKIQALVPDAVVSYAHGQMDERTLEKIMADFINGEIDVLVSTTIIETGLDISNVNTMIIHDADQFGLSQLYQLRGRVGRSNRTAYAFLLYKRNKMLKEVAEKRLQAIKEFSDLGSGFKIAMKDLEIRGAGSVLGEQQHGHMAAVGYDLYCKMLNQAVEELKGIKKEEDFDTTVDINVDAFIPATYIKSEGQKLDIYKRIATIETDEELSDMEDELTDRYGDIPKAASNLLKIALIKAKAHKAYVTEIKGSLAGVRVKMYPEARIDTAVIPEIVKEYSGRLKFNMDKEPYFTYMLDKESSKDAKSFLSALDLFMEKLLTSIK